MNQAEAHPTFAETNAEPVVCLEQAHVLHRSEALSPVRDPSASNFVLDADHSVQNQSSMFFVLNSDGSICTMNSPQVVSIQGNCTVKDQSDLVYVKNSEIHNLEKNIDVTIKEENNNIVFEKRNVVEEETSSIYDYDNDFASVISSAGNTNNSQNNNLFGRKSQVENISEAAPNELRTNPSRKCSVVNCSNPNGKAIHTFPAIVINGKINHENLNRCKLWIKDSGNTELLNQFSSKLYRRYGICGDHFDSSQYYNPQTIKRLLPNAVPSLNICLPIPDIDMNLYPKWGPGDILADLTLNTEDTENGINKTSVENCQQENNHDTNEQAFKPDCYQSKFENVLHTLEWRTCNQ
ncbi:THAP domain-containing protein 5 [Frankliniella fusca]|uniref:THAP domain-containing protein 5 n=1 Tax=Frankliniella fusca TaxID=407009 RepID=A0AAE1LPW4_9NEOP|nr:THAP domain-containing protein 5 [Frankliniella fusca]